MTSDLGIFKIVLPRKSANLRTNSIHDLEAMVCSCLMCDACHQDCGRLDVSVQKHRAEIGKAAV